MLIVPKCKCSLWDNLQLEQVYMIQTLASSMIMEATLHWGVILSEQLVPCSVMSFYMLTKTSLNFNFLTSPPHPPVQGDQYWRLDGNMVVEPGFPKPLAFEFPGLTGTISAALAVPATRSTLETVYFFKNGEEDRQSQKSQGS